MDIVIEPYYLNKKYFALSMKNYQYYIQLGWIKRFIFDDSDKDFLIFLNNIKYSNKFKNYKIILFNNINDAQYAIDLLNSIIILKILTQ